MAATGDVYRFGELELELELEPGRAQIRRAGSPVHLEPKTSDLLL